MESPDMNGDQDLQMLQAFREMGPLLDQYIRPNDETPKSRRSNITLTLQGPRRNSFFG